MVTLTAVAVKKIKEVMELQDPKPNALRVGVRGGGCSGFSYAMEFDNKDVRENDHEFEQDGLKLRVDNMSAMYLEGCEIDYIDTIPESGFKFSNPNVKNTCGCGSSFSV